MPRKVPGKKYEVDTTHDGFWSKNLSTRSPRRSAHVVREGSKNLADVGSRDVGLNEINGRSDHMKAWGSPRTSASSDLSGVLSDLEGDRPQRLRHKKKSSSLWPGDSLHSTFKRLALQPEAENSTRLTQHEPSPSSGYRPSYRSTILQSYGLTSMAIATPKAGSEAKSPVGRASRHSETVKNRGLGRLSAAESNTCPRFPSLHNMQQHYRASIEPSITMCKTCGKRKRA
jgi:hypothetical protein